MGHRGWVGVGGACPLAGWRLSVVGGDARLPELARFLASRGAEVRMAGVPRESTPPGTRWAPGVAEAVAGADGIILPPGFPEAGGRVRVHPGWPGELRLAPEALRQVRPGCRLVAGRATPELERLCAEAGLRLLELERDEAFNLLNATVTAEAAVSLAMRHLPVTLHGSRAAVVGLGRCGQQIARLLAALGARVAAVAFGPVEEARAYGMGIEAFGPRQLQQALRQADAVFNTAPAPLLGEPVLAAVAPDAVVVDIASGPGGTDFKAAERLGLLALHARGLPAAYAPRTAGQLMAQAVERLLLAHSLEPKEPAVLVEEGRCSGS